MAASSSSSSSSSSSTPTTPLAILRPPVSSAPKLVPLPSPQPRTQVLGRRRRPRNSISSLHVPPRALVGFSPEADEADPEPVPLTLRRICGGHVPEHVLRRMEEVGYELATDVQREGLPALFSGRDCVLHAQTGSGKTLTYLLGIFSVVNTQLSSVQV